MENEKHLIYKEDLLAEYDRVHIGPPGGARKLIEEAPSVDAVEVVHGRWIYDHWCEFRCSICGEWSNSKPYKGKENYCPNCGAKMDGDKL